MPVVYHLTISDPDEYARRGQAAEHRHVETDPDVAEAKRKQAEELGFNARVDEVNSTHTHQPVTASLDCQDWCPINQVYAGAAYDWEEERGNCEYCNGKPGGCSFCFGSGLTMIPTQTERANDIHGLPLSDTTRDWDDVVDAPFGAAGDDVKDRQEFRAPNKMKRFEPVVDAPLTTNSKLATEQPGYPWHHLDAEQAIDHLVEDHGLTEDWLMEHFGEPDAGQDYRDSLDNPHEKAHDKYDVGKYGPTPHTHYAQNGGGGGDGGGGGGNAGGGAGDAGAAAGPSCGSTGDSCNCGGAHTTSGCSGACGCHGFAYGYPPYGEYKQHHKKKRHHHGAALVDCSWCGHSFPQDEISYCDSCDKPYCDDCHRSSRYPQNNQGDWDGCPACVGEKKREAGVKVADHSYDDDAPDCSEGDGKQAVAKFLDKEVCPDHLRYYLADAPSQLAKAQQGVQTSASVDRLKYEDLVQKLKIDIGRGRETLRNIDRQEQLKTSNTGDTVDHLCERCGDAATHEVILHTGMRGLLCEAHTVTYRMAAQASGLDSLAFPLTKEALEATTCTGCGHLTKGHNAVGCLGDFQGPCECTKGVAPPAPETDEERSMRLPPADYVPHQMREKPGLVAKTAGSCGECGGTGECPNCLGAADFGCICGGTGDCPTCSGWGETEDLNDERLYPYHTGSVKVGLKCPKCHSEDIDLSTDLNYEYQCMECGKKIRPVKKQGQQVTHLHEDPYAPKGETEVQLKGRCMRCDDEVTAGSGHDFGDGKWACASCAPSVAANPDLYKSAHAEQHLAYFYELDPDWEKVSQNMGCPNCLGSGSNADGSVCQACFGTGHGGGMMIHPGSVTAPEGMVGVLYGDDGDTYRSTDGGATWEKVGQADIPPDGVRDFCPKCNDDVRPYAHGMAFVTCRNCGTQFHRFRPDAPEERPWDEISNRQFHSGTEHNEEEEEEDDDIKLFRFDHGPGEGKDLVHSEIHQQEHTGTASGASTRDPALNCPTCEGEGFVYLNDPAYGTPSDKRSCPTCLGKGVKPDRDDEICHHGLSAWLCEDPVNHYPSDRFGWKQQASVKVSQMTGKGCSVCGSAFHTAASCSQSPDSSEQSKTPEQHLHYVQTPQAVTAQAGTSEMDLVDNVPAGEPEADGRRDFITDHLGEVATGVEPATCRTCSEPMEMHPQWSPTHQGVVKKPKKKTQDELKAEKLEHQRKKNEEAADKTEEVLNKVNNFLTSGSAGTSVHDLVDNVGSGEHSVPVVLITDHLGETRQGTEPATCVLCEAPMEQHAQFAPTKQRMASRPRRGEL